MCITIEQSFPKVMMGKVSDLSSQVQRVGVAANRH